MAEEEETREVLFPDWEGPDKTGLTIEQTSGGELFVKEVKGESPAARSGKVYEGDQIVGATVYFDNMSSEETAELLKTLNRHKVGLKLQNKSPCCSPVSTPCRSPIGTLTWEGKTRFGGSSPDIILSGEDEDYKRIYTKKIKPRLKSEDLAEGVDVRTERHSSTSSDGSTITTITRRITTYTVDMPGGISEQLELSSPEFKGLQQESGDGTSYIRISHGSPSGNVKPEEGVFESSNVSFSGPQVSSTETRWGSGGVQIKTTTREVERDRGPGLGSKGSNFGATGVKGQGDFEILRGSGEQGDRNIQLSGTSKTLRDSTNTGSKYVTIGGLVGGEVTSTDENGGSISMSLPGKSMQILTSSIDKTQEGSADASSGERTKVKVSEEKGSGSIDLPNVRLGGGSIGSDAELRGGRIGGTTTTGITVGNVTSGYFSKPGKISVAGVDVNLTGSKLKGEVDVNLPSTKGGIKSSRIDTEVPGYEYEEVRKPEADIRGIDTQIRGPSSNIEGPVVSVRLPEADFKAPEINSSIQTNVPKSDSKYKVEVSKVKIPSLSGPDTDLNLKGSKAEGGIGVAVLKPEGELKAPKIDIKGPAINIEGEEGDLKMPQIKIRSYGAKGPRVDIKARKTGIEAPEVDGEGVKFKMPSKTGPTMPESDISLKGSKVKVEMDVSVPKIEGHTTKPDVETNINVKAPGVDIHRADIDTEGPNAKLKEAKFNIPTISGTKLSMPSVDFSQRGPEIKGDVDVSAPKIEGDIKITGVDIKGPKSGFGIKTPKMEGPDVDVKLPKANIDVKAPEFDIKGPGFDIEGPEAKIRGPEFKLPTITGDIDVSVPKIVGEMKTPKVKIEGQDVDIEGHKGEFKMPKFSKSSLGIKGPKVQGQKVDVSLPKADIDIKAPEVDIAGQHIKTPELDIKGPSVDIEGPKGGFKMPKIEGDIKTPELDIKGPRGGFQMPKVKMPTFDVKGPRVEGPDVDINLPKGGIDVKMPELDMKAPKVDIEGPDLDIEGPKGGFKMPKFGLPKFGLKGPKVEGPEVDVSLPKADIDIKAPEVDIKGPDLDIEGPSGKIKGPKFNMPKLSGPKLSMPDVDFNLRGPNLKGDVDVSVPKIEGDIKTPELNIKGPSVDIEGPKGGFEMPKIKIPSLGLKGPKLEGPSVDINLPKSNIDVKAPHVDYNLKGKMDASAPKLDADIKGPNTNIAVPTITMEGLSVDPVKTGVTFPKFKGPKFGMKSPEVQGKTPTFSVGVKGPKTEVSLPDNEASLDAPDININVKGKKGKFKLPKGKGKVKKPDVDIETPAVDLDVDTPHIHVKGTKVKKPLFGKLHFPDVELDIKSPKLKGDGSFSEGFRSPDTDFPSASLNTAIEGSGIGGPNVNVSTSDIDANLNRQGEVSMSAGFKGPKINVKGSAEVDASASGGSASGGLHYPEGTVIFPKIKVPKFGIALPQLEGQGHGGNVESASGGINIQSPSVSCQVSSQNIEVPSPELRHSEGKVKVKMPKLFGKSKAKGSSAGDLRGPELELSTSGKGGKVHAGELMGGKLELEGDPGLSVSTKSKSASLDLFQRSRHRSSSDEGGLAGSSPSAHLEAEGGDISLDLGGSKVKGKKGKLKFGTFGGFGSKSKGSYEVSLGEESEAGVSLPSKKSRLSSSSSSDSGSRGGFRFPRLELSVSPKK